MQYKVCMFCCHCCWCFILWMNTWALSNKYITWIIVVIVCIWSCRLFMVADLAYSTSILFSFCMLVCLYVYMLHIDQNNLNRFSEIFGNIKKCPLTCDLYNLLIFGGHALFFKNVIFAKAQGVLLWKFVHETLMM